MGRLNLLGGQINLLGGLMPTQLTCYLPPWNWEVVSFPSRDLASGPSTCLFRWAIVIFDGQKNDHDGFVDGQNESL